MIEKPATTPPKIAKAIFHSTQSTDALSALSAVLESGHRPKEVPSSSSADFPEIR